MRPGTFLNRTNGKIRFLPNYVRSIMANSSEDEYGESDEEPCTEGPNPPRKAALTIRDFFAPQNALFARHGAPRGSIKMLKDINDGAVLPDKQHCRRVQAEHLENACGPGPS